MVQSLFFIFVSLANEISFGPKKNQKFAPFGFKLDLFNNPVFISIYGNTKYVGGIADDIFATTPCQGTKKVRLGM